MTTENYTTAAEYLQEQRKLEQEAVQLMPYDPDKCTYSYGPIRQMLFACLTCSKKKKKQSVLKNQEDKQAVEEFMNAVCYSCSIQCHADHELIELFSKRNFTCDCGTTRMTDACYLRNRIQAAKPTHTIAEDASCSSDSAAATSVPILRSGISLANLQPATSLLPIRIDKDAKADDIPSSSNVYSQNFKNLFCSCSQPYNPSSESGNMIQCQFGVSCGEEWYHEECILGIKPHMVDRKKKLENENNNASDLDGENYDVAALPGFPGLETFEGFVCWKCVTNNLEFFEALSQFEDICLPKVYHIDNSTSLQFRNDKIDEYLKQKKGQAHQDDGSKGTSSSCKRIKLEEIDSSKQPDYSLFLKDDYQDIIKARFITSANEDKYPKITNFLLENGESLFIDEPIYEPPEDDDVASETSSLYDLGAKALETLPPEKAMQGLQAYQQIKSKLTEFLRPFADKGEIVTEDKIRMFFDKMKDS